MTTQIDNSTFLQATSYGLLPESTVESSSLEQIKAAFQADHSSGDPNASLIVAVVLNRAEDASSILNGSWGERQTAIQQADFWSQYGADTATYDAVKTELVNRGAVVLDTGGYISTAESRTIWVKVDNAAFQSIFGQELHVLKDAQDNKIATVWAGSLTLPDSIATDVGGFWVDQNVAAVPVQVGGSGVVLEEGQQGTANYDYGQDKYGVTGTPMAIADYYNYPLNAKDLQTVIETPNIGLVEPQLDDATYESLLTQLNAYRTDILKIAPLTRDELLRTIATDGKGYTESEMTLDVSIVSGAAPTSDMIFYSKLKGDATTFAATQQAIWDEVNKPVALTSSFSDMVRYAADSPFAWAYEQLMQDAALRNVTIAMSAGDGGSGQEYANGVTNGRDTHLNSWSLVVSATSLSPINTAMLDSSIATLVSNALNLDPTTLFGLAQSGLKVLPTQLPSLPLMQPLAGVAALTEAIWNQYVITNGQMGAQDYSSNYSGSGGVDTTQAIPQYQLDFGLMPVDVSNGRTGRGVPDVAALGGGSMFYYVLYYLQGDPTYSANAGTSSATPMWASLTAQMDAVFHDIGLPNLGFYNDILYQAAAISPGAFNDVTLGNNISSYFIADKDTPYAIFDQGLNAYIVPTGLGYQSGEGYDLTTGLGTPDGLLLTRALATIANHELYGVDDRVLSSHNTVSGTVNTDQTLLVQSTLANGANVAVNGVGALFEFGGSSSIAWDARLAEKVMQFDFSPDLVRLLDGASQATPGSMQVAAGELMGMSFNNSQAGLYQANDTNDYGFVTWGSSSGGVTVARPVVVAETPLGQDDVNAVVRIRQNGVYDQHLTLYRVDDLSGHIGGLAPGDAGYAAAAAGRAYSVAGGGTVINGPGYGQFSQTQITNVDRGDIIAFSLTSHGQTYWGFSGGNEVISGQPVTHLWSYGANTFGFEDTYGGGDRDFNDLLVQLDLMSHAGSGLLV
ncbi:DUF4114 domain-containing protein [Reyranella sp.]|uniref:DUF4114 domain-containing protein n=1 Tax=Reyranella sp. TaxID=1929291 RepID=UPI004036A3F0